MGTRAAAGIFDDADDRPAVPINSSSRAYTARLHPSGRQKEGTIRRQVLTEQRRHAYCDQVQLLEQDVLQNKLAPAGKAAAGMIRRDGIAP